MENCEWVARKSGSRIEALIGGRLWKLRTAGNLEELWEKIGGEDYSRIPYWTELWPSSIALGEWLCIAQEEIRGKTCLDLGCGLGLTALIGQSLGANVAGIDYEPAALACCRANAALNHCPEPAWLLMDWASPGLKMGRADILWAADVAYEEAFWEPLLNLMAQAVAGGRAWLAEPGRTIFYSFLRKARAGGWSARPVHRRIIPEWNGQKNGVRTAIWEFTRG